jgi:F-type H+-transporting ATPase subunit alpha
LKNVAVKNVKAFEEHFLMEMENKYPEILADFKKGNLPEEGLKKMTELANGLSAQYK